MLLESYHEFYLIACNVRLYDIHTDFRSESCPPPDVTPYEGGEKKQYIRYGPAVRNCIAP